MEITSPCVVSLTWTLKDSLGETLDVLDEPVEFLVGGTDLLPKIEEALQGHGAGAQLQLSLEPIDAFGDFDENMLFLEPRSAFPRDIEEGMIVSGDALPQGLSGDIPKDALYTVSEIYPEHIVLDGNHPLSGIGLRLELTVQGVREASDSEIEHGSLGTGFFQVQPMAPGGNSVH